MRSMHFVPANAGLHALSKMHRPFALAHLQQRNAKSTFISGANFTTVHASSFGARQNQHLFLAPTLPPFTPHLCLLTSITHRIQILLS
jgi:hypothetical protein